MSNEIKELITILLGAFLLVCVLFIPIGAAVYAVQKQMCEATTARMKFPHAYTYWTGCMIEVRGQWIFLDNYRVVEN